MEEMGAGPSAPPFGDHYSEQRKQWEPWQAKSFCN